MLIRASSALKKIRAAIQALKKLAAATKPNRGWPIGRKRPGWWANLTGLRGKYSSAALSERKSEFSFLDEYLLSNMRKTP